MNIALLAVLLARTAAAQPIPEGVDTGYGLCICDDGRRLNMTPGSQSCDSFCNGSGAPSRGSDYGAIQRAQADQAAREQTAREQREREAAAEAARRARKAMEQEKFEKDKAEAVRSLKGVSSASGELKGYTGTNAFGIKGVSMQEAGLKTLKTGSAPSPRLNAWQQLVCAASIGTALTEQAKTAKTREDLAEVDHLADQAGRAMDGAALDVTCDPAGPLASSFKPWENEKKRRYTEFLKTVASVAEKKVQAEEKLPKLSAKVQGLELKVETLQRELAAQPKPPEPSSASAPPGRPAPKDEAEPRRKESALEAARKALAEAKKLRAEMEKQRADAAARLEQADKASEAFAKDPSAKSSFDELSGKR
jgi:hypothetical protein